MKVQVKIVNAFIDNDNGGNPAGVVIDADHITHKQKLAIAKKVGLSETAFVSQSKSADFKLDFYTPNRQIAHCGHATIAVFSYLAQVGKLGQGWFTKETIDGNRRILIEKDMAYMEQLAPKYTEIEKYHQEILESIGITENKMLRSPLLVNTGNSFVIIGVDSKQTLAHLKPNFDAIAEISKELDLIGYYVYSLNTSQVISDATTRMFFPRYGVNEEAATGMAAGPLACFLYDKANIKKSTYNIEQGYFMTPPSASKITINLDISDDEIISLMAGGKAKTTQELTIEL